MLNSLIPGGVWRKTGSTIINEFLTTSFYTKLCVLTAQLQVTISLNYRDVIECNYLWLYCYGVIRWCKTEYNVHIELLKALTLW